ncbi:MAG: hypothetical protein J6S91_07180, partial [Treponema sp.]|nr:hypothetical protein [Treponema sp.]
MKKSALFILAALTVFAACSKEEVSDKTNKATSLVFTATFADSPADEELKATFASLKASWAAGDKILIRDSNGNEAVYAADAAGTTSSFSFESGDALSTSGVTYEAFFPSTAASELPLVQVLGTNGSDVTRFEAPMRASGTTTSLAFKNLCGLLKLNVTKASAAAGFNLKYILLEANKGLSGAYTVSSDAAVVSGSTPSVLNMASATSLGTTAKTFYMSVPAGSYSKFDITIMHNNTASFYEQTWSLKSGQSLSITRNTVTSLDLEINNPAINLSRDWANSGNIYTYGTANCYNAKVTNTRYKIRTVKGNSIESVGSVNSADLLWAATTSSTAPTSAQIGNLVKNVHYSNGYVYFERGGSQSNFAVAAKDASGNILWSWLIWGANAGFSDVEMVGGATMMDRNIGAFGTNVGGTSVIGLLYQ